MIAIINCHARPQFQQAIRSTWLPQVPRDLVDVKFFLGRGATREPLPDEVFLPCGDAYLDLPEKVQEMYRWAVEHDASYALKCDDDVILKPQQWASGFLRTDFSGWQDPGCKAGEMRTPWGFCYVLNKNCMERVINAPLPGRPGALHNYVHGNDEAYVSSVLHYQGIYLTSDPRYFLYMGQKPKPGEGHGAGTLGEEPKRALRARPPRFTPPPRVPVLDYFAACVYLNWTGWHNTGPDVILREFHRIFKDGL